MSEPDNQAQVVAPEDAEALAAAIIVDCRFSLADPEAGRRAWESGHVPGAFYLDLNRDLSGPTGRHGGRHPLPDAQDFANTLAGLGIHRGSNVIAYDDSGFAFAARLWWMMRSLGYRPPRLLDGGYSAWLALGHAPETAVPIPDPCESPDIGHFTGVVDSAGVRDAQARGAWLVDAREPRRYRGEEENIDPVAGHIPGALNRPWQSMSDDTGRLLGDTALREQLGEVLEAPELVVYCGSGVTACVDLFALDRAGRDDALLYGGSWSDWCSYLEPDGAGP